MATIYNFHQDAPQLLTGVESGDKLLIHDVSTGRTKWGEAGDFAAYITENHIGFFVVTDPQFGGTAGDGVTSDQSAITNAVSTAFAEGFDLYWPPGTYLTTASIPNFHSVRHRGPGRVKRGSDLFPVEPRSTSLNKLYCSPTGSTSNDGLSSGQPMRPKTAFDALRNYGFLLRGTWTIQLAASTYSTSGTDNNLTTNSLRSENPIIVQGPSVGGHPNVPTAIISPGGAKGWEFQYGINLAINDIRFSDFTTSSALVFEDKCRVTLTNVHVFNCLTGLNVSSHSQLFMSGGIIDGNLLASATGIKAIFLNYLSIGDGSASPALTAGPVIRKCNQGIYFAENSRGHVNAAFEDCTVGLDMTSGSRANFDASDFKRCAMAIRGSNNSEAWSNDAFNFNNATLDENTENIRIRSSALNLFSAPTSEDWATEKRDMAISSLTGSVAETFMRSFLWGKERFFGNPGSGYVGKCIRIMARGDKTGALGQAQMVVRIHTAASTGGTQVAGISTLAAAGRWEFEAEIHLHTDDSHQSGFAVVRQHGQVNRMGADTDTVDLHDNQDHYFNFNIANTDAGDTTTVDYFLVEVLG